MINKLLMTLADNGSGAALGYEEHWQNELVKQHPEAREVIGKVHGVLNDIVCLAECTLRTVGKARNGLG